MSESQPANSAQAGTVVAVPETRDQTRPMRQPPYHVLLHDDDDHTYEYVIEMLVRLFGHTVEQAYQLAVEVDTEGRAAVDTTTLERAELKRDQIHAYGRDRRLRRSAGSMTATIEPAPQG